MVMDIGSLLSQWEAQGVFDFLLPFLLIFAVIFGILTTTNILGGAKNKGVHVVIAFVIGLLALRLDFVPRFFAEIFPRLGVGLAVILTLIILIGLFVPQDEMRFWLWGLGAIAFIIAIVVISQSFEGYGWFSSGSYSDYVGWIIGAVLVIGLIIAVSAAGNDDSKKKTENAVLVPWRN
ncbi:MAG: hypothetical protein Q7R87_05060 [Nanoarchaeota archaeon]|nr:hypothetical protein [Nanoarchaeota archaeon]